MKFFLFLLMASISISCFHRSHKAATTVYSGNAMTIDYRIIVGTSLSEKENKSLAKIIGDTFHEVHVIYNKWNPSSELSLLNKIKAGEVVSLSPQLENFLKFTERIVELSEGKFDPTIEPLQQVWKANLASGHIPSKKEIEKVVPAIGWDKIHFAQGQFYKDHDLTSIDLGGIAKGYCVDLLIERFNAAGYPDVYVEWGGEIRASGFHPEKRPWKIFISLFGDPDPQKAIDIISLQNQAIATSGDYLQQWKVFDEKTQKTVTYFHIIDPQTYQPLIATSQSVASASVLAPTCAFADGLATIAMMFSSEKEAEAWAKKITGIYPDVQFWIKDNKTRQDKAGWEQDKINRIGTR